MLIAGALWMWFGLTAFSLIYLVYALIYKTPGPWVMKLAWLLVVLYTGPFGLFIYLLSCQEPLHGTHEHYIAFRWKQSVGSEVHCLAGDATGIIIAAVAVSFFTVTSGTEMLIEYIAGFISGLFIFQALFMKHSMGGTYWQAIKGTFMSEWLSMNFIMAGMLPVMFIWRAYQPSAADPSTLEFWGSMSLASLVGGVLAYPINDWLVTKGLKHGMATVRKPGEKVASITMPSGHGQSHPGHQAAGSHTASNVSTQSLVIASVLSLVVLGAGITLGLWFQ